MLGQCQTKQILRGTKQAQKCCSGRLGLVGLLWSGGWTPEEFSLFVFLHSNKIAQHSTASVWPQSLHACGCFSNNRERRDWRSTLVKCVSLCQWNHTALWSCFTHLTQHTQTVRLSQAVCQLSENSLRLHVAFSFSKPVTPRKQERYFPSEICYRCNPPMLLSGKTNEHQFSFITFHSTKTHTHTNTHIIKSSAPPAEDILYYTAGADSLLLMLFVSPVWWSWVSLGHSQSIVGSHRT